VARHQVDAGAAARRKTPGRARLADCSGAAPVEPVARRSTLTLGEPTA